MYIEVPENLARRIHELAQGDDERLAELLGVVIDKYDENPPKWATLADLVRHADAFRERMNNESSSDTLNAASHDREVLVAELADRVPAV